MLRFAKRRCQLQRYTFGLANALSSDYDIGIHFAFLHPLLRARV
jgi:hypothetical protein